MIHEMNTGAGVTINKSYIVDREVLNLRKTHYASSILSSYIPHSQPKVKDTEQKCPWSSHTCASHSHSPAQLP